MEKTDLYVNGNFYKELMVSQKLLTYGAYQEYIVDDLNNFLSMGCDWDNMNINSSTCTYATVKFDLQTCSAGTLQLHCNDKEIRIGKNGLIKIKKEKKVNECNSRSVVSRFELMEI